MLEKIASNASRFVGSLSPTAYFSRGSLSNSLVIKTPLNSLKPGYNILGQRLNVLWNQSAITALTSPAFSATWLFATSQGFN